MNSCDEFDHSGVRLQGSNRCILPCQFGFCERSVDLALAYIMQQHSWSPLASFQFWDQMVHTLRNAGRDWSVA